MKAIKIFLSMGGLLLASGCFGQLLPPDNPDMLYYSAYYNKTENRFEHLVHRYPERTTSGDHFEESPISRTYFADGDTHRGAYAGMSIPSEDNLYEQELMIEAWMLTPFESSYYEPDIPVESWMTAPFETTEVFEDEIEIEPWMTSTWL